MWAIVFILAFDLYWLFFLFYTMALLLASYLTLSAERNTDWLGRARRLSEGDMTSDKTSETRTWRARLSDRLHQKRVRALMDSGAAVPAFENVYHVVIIPILTEGTDIGEPCIASLLKQDFPLDRTIIVMAIEERAAPSVRNSVWALRSQHMDAFCAFYISPHPTDTEGEAPVKGANVTYAAKMAGQALEQRGIHRDDTIVTCLDADSVLDPRYLSCLTYHYMVYPKRTRCSYQPIPVYHNNVWDAPPVACMLEVGSSFFQMVEATDPEKLVSFSSHSISLSALEAIDYWPLDMVSDDSSIFWKAFLHFEGDYRVVPMPITLSMDVVQSDTLWKTLTSIYRQKRRWAWGIENFPIVMRGFLHTRQISTWNKTRHAFKMLYKHVAWSTWAFLLLVINLLPALLTAGECRVSAAYYLAPRVQPTILLLASLGLVLTIVLSLVHLPKPPPNYPFHRRLRHLAAWLWLPLAAIVLSALPTLDAQTRLMFGRGLSSKAMEKKRHSGSSQRRSHSD